MTQLIHKVTQLLYAVLEICSVERGICPFGGSYVCANCGENRSRNATVRVPTDGHTHTLTDANRFYNPSHAICHSYAAEIKGGQTLRVACMPYSTKY